MFRAHKVGQTLVTSLFLHNQCWAIWGAQTREMSPSRVHFEQFGCLSSAESLEIGPFCGHKWAYNGSKQNQNVLSFRGRVGLQVVMSGLHECIRLFCMAQWYQGLVSLLLLIFLAHYSRVWHLRQCDPIHYLRHLALFNSLVSIVCRVLLHFTASNSELQSLKLLMIVHFTTMQVKPLGNCIACTIFLALLVTAWLSHIPSS